MSVDSDHNKAQGCMVTDKLSKQWSCDQFSIGSHGGVHATKLDAHDWTCAWHEIGIVQTPRSVTVCFGDDPVRKIDMLQQTFGMMPAGTPGSTICAAAAHPIFVRFSKEIKKQVQDASPQSLLMDAPRAPQQKLRNGAIHIALIREFLDMEGYGGRLRAESLLMLLIGDAYHSLSNGAPAKMQPSLTAAQLATLTDYIDSHLDTQLNTEKLAALVGCSPFHFIRLFKATTGLSPHKFIMKHRIEKAKSILSVSSESISEVAYKVGFSSQSHMTTAFKNEVGETPAKFRLIMST